MPTPGAEDMIWCKDPDHTVSGRAAQPETLNVSARRSARRHQDPHRMVEAASCCT